MPLVQLSYKGDRELGPIAKQLAGELPELVARTLSVPDNEKARLEADDIEVHVRQTTSFDVNTKDLEIIIWANEYPERLANLDFRKEVILHGVREFLRDYDRNLTGFVWVLLQPGSFGSL